MNLEINYSNTKLAMNPFNYSNEFKNKPINELTFSEACHRHDTSRFRSFMNAEEALIKEWGKKHFKKWEDQLNDDQKWAIRTYTGEASMYINGILRETIDFPNSPYERHGFTINTALSNASIPEDIILYRITGKGVLGKYKCLPAESLVGRVIYDKTFMSTSLIPSQRYNGNILLIIKAPKGSKGAYLGDLSLHENEAEVLLNKEQNMIIEEVNKLDSFKYELALTCRILMDE